MAGQVLQEKDLKAMGASPQIIEAYLSLKEEWEVAEDEIAQLEQELKQKTGKKGKRSDDDYGDAAEVERLQRQVDDNDRVLAAKNEKIDDLEQRLKSTNTELAELRRIEKAQSDQIATIQKEMANRQNEGQQNRSDVNKLKKDLTKANEENRRLYDENDKLQQTIEQLEKAVSLYTEHNDKLTLHVQDLTERHDFLQEHKDTHETRQEELEVQLKELQEKLERTQEELLAAQDDSEWESQVENLKKGLKQSQDKAAADSKAAKAEIASLQEKVKTLSNDTLIGKKVKELETQQAALKENLQLLDEMSKQLSAAEKNRSEAVESLRKVEDNIEQRVAERVLAEREKNRSLERTLASLMARTSDESSKHGELEKENAALHRQIDELSNWKTTYEAGHGLQGMARDQKKLKDDNRRLTVAIEQMTAKLGAVMDANGMLAHSFERLKIECGKPPSFSYPDYQLSEEMKTENMRLQSQMNEVEDQLAALEGENSRLRKALKSQAGSIGEQGFKFAGMTPEQLVKVNEFAAGLREGKIELPVDDRSAKLLKENKRLREEREGLQMQLQGYERQLLGGGAMPAAAGPRSAASEAEMLGLREDMQKLLAENSELRERMSTMQNEVVLLLRQSVGKTDSRNEDIEAMLLAHNEQLSRQMAELKSHALSSQNLSTQQQQQLQQQIQHQQQQQQQQQQHQADKKSGKQKQTPAAPKVPRGPKGAVETPAAAAGPAAVPVVQYAQTPAMLMMPSTGGMFTAPPTAYAGPGTPHGKALLGRTLNQLNLPPEEWAEEVKDINGQLVECLEQLFERERELEESSSVVAGLEDNLVAIKQQLAAVYYDYAQRSDAWEAREKELKATNVALHNERDDLQLKVRRMQEMVANTGGDPKSVEDKLMEVSRKLTVYEVNEAVLARKYTSQAEQLANEQQTRERLEANFVEMESLLKKRILYLEQYKLSASSRLGYLQGRVDSSVPQGDYLELQSELECLREEHLKALRREVDARVTALRAKEQAVELRTLRVNQAHMEADLAAARASALNLSTQLEHQKEYTTRALAAAGQKSSSELSSIISEMAKYRGETGRLEVELAAATRRAEAVSEQVHLATKEAGEATVALAEVEAREEEASAKESAALKAKLETEIKYQGGMTREESDNVRHKVDKLTRELEEATREVARHKELAEIASQQAQTIGQFRAAHAEELTELREHCMRLESRSDDDILIGKLQRQLMATKTSYKAFVNKYQHMRADMRSRELAVRTLETRLDQREETVLKMQEAHRLQVQALKKALRTVQNSVEDEAVKVTDGKDKRKGRAGVKFVSMGQKLLQMSARVNALADLAEQAMKKAAAAESENLSMEGVLQDVQAEKELLAAQARDLEALHKGGKGKQQAVAARLVSLSEDVRVNKLACLQQRRQIQVLRAEKKHLQQVLSNFEADMETLEEGKVLAETKNLLSSLPSDESKKLASASLDADVTDLPFDEAKLPLSVSEPVKGPKKNLVIQVDSLETAGFAGNSDPELLERIETLSSQLTTVSKEASVLKLQGDRFKDQMNELQRALQEREGQLQYYERMARQEGLPLIGSSTSLPQIGGIGTQGGNARQVRQLKEEQNKLQEAAAATISSLKSLLEEKNRLIESYRKKVEDLGGEKRTKSRADKKADELLQRLNESERAGSPSKSRRAAALDSDDLPTATRQLVEQVEQADSIIMEKDRLVNQLEQKLAQQVNQRERAEVRCGTAIKEMEAMKGDMVTLAQQLQLAEERLRRMTGRPVGAADPGDKRVNDLQKALKAKDDKVRGYREIIIRLKEEFIKAEEDKAAAAVSAAKSGKGAGASDGATGLGADEVKDLRAQIGALRDGLRQAKDDLEGARKTREKLAQARAAAQEENERLESAVGRAEAQAAAAQETLHRTRKDLEETRKKEARLRDRLKELLEAEGGSEKVRDLKAAAEKINSLERDVELLRAQNTALRRAQDDPSGTGRAAPESPSPLRGTATASSSKAGVPPRPSTATFAGSSSKGHPGEFPAGPGDSSGHTLGMGEGPQDELRAQLHTKWENEKKLQKRILVVEKRLQEKLEENEELQGQLKRARDAVQQAVSAKDEALKKASASAKSAGANAGGAHGKASLDDVVAAEQSSARIFQLEEQMALLRRKAEVEQPNEIAALRHRLAVVQSRVGELEVELEEAEDRRKKATSQGPGGRSLRDSEDRFLREERLKDELDIARRQRLELEAALLDRDARAIEHRFDIESKEGEVERMRRRVRELEAAYRSAASATGAKLAPDASKSSSAAGGGGSAAQRERDLEGVIEAMKRVVDKLKAENERLKKSGGSEAKAGESEKRAAAEKKRADKLEEDLKGLTAKLKGHEESSQRLIQKQEQINKLRKQLKQRDDELAAAQAESGAGSDEVDTLKRKLQNSEARIQNLEAAVQQAEAKAARGAGAGAGAAASSKEVEALRKRAVEHAAEVEAVRADLAVVQRRAAELEKQLASGAAAGGGGSGGHPAALQAEMRQLREENKNLRQELSAFDLDFFNEIEQLKFEHSEAVKKLRAYEAASGAGGRR